MLKFNRCLSCHILSGHLIYVYQPIASLMVQAAHSSPSSIIVLPVSATSPNIPIGRRTWTSVEH